MSTWIPKILVVLKKYFMFLDYITKLVEEGGSLVDVTYLLFFQKAFNKVSRQRILFKLKAHSMGDGMINSMEKLLTDRRQ